jgi:hypothetical protein
LLFVEAHFAGQDSACDKPYYVRQRCSGSNTAPRIPAIRGREVDPGSTVEPGVASNLAGLAESLDDFRGVRHVRLERAEVGQAILLAIPQQRLGHPAGRSDQYPGGARICSSDMPFSTCWATASWGHRSRAWVVSFWRGWLAGASTQSTRCRPRRHAAMVS